MKQRHGVSFLAGMAAGLCLLVNVYLYSSDLSAILRSYQEARVPKPPVIAFDNRQDPGYDREIHMTMDEFWAFPESRMVLREGEKTTLAPEARILDGQYLDISLKSKLITLFENGEPQALYRVVAIGPPSAPTPKGTFSLLSKEERHFASKEKVWMPWAMRVVDGIFIHGIPYYPNGTLLGGRYSHGCIRVPTAMQQELFARIAIGTPVVIY